MSLAMGLIGGAGKGAADIADQNVKLWGEKELEQQRSDAALAREQSILRLKQQMAEAPLLRVQGKAKELIGQPVPQEAAPVDNLTGAGLITTDGKAPTTAGFKGDPEAIRKSIEALPESVDKQQALAQLNAQVSGDRQINQEAVAGKTRPRTAQEALDSAVDWAKTNDLPAVAAYEAAIGKPARDERRVDILDKRADTQDKAVNAREKRDEARQVAYDKKMDSDDEYRRRREERLDKLADLQEQRLNKSTDKAETQSQRVAVAALMTSTERELERTMTLAKDPMLGEPEKKMFEGRIAALTKDLGRYRKSLEGFGGDGVVAPDTPAPSGRNGWDSTTGDVYKDGKVIGKAKSEKDARGVFTGGVKAPEPTTAPAPRPLVDAEGEPIPGVTRPLDTGYAAPDVRPVVKDLLKTPSYRAGSSGFNPS